jgi:hypothetical protein
MWGGEIHRAIIHHSTSLQMAAPAIMAILDLSALKALLHASG